MSCRESGRLSCVLRCAAVVLACAGFAVVGAAEPRLVVQVAWPFAINGTLYPPGTLTLRQVADYTPSSSLDEVWVGDECIGMVMTRLARTQRRATKSTAIFRRGEDGNLQLFGYTLASSGSGRTFVLSPTGLRPGSGVFRAEGPTSVQAARR